MNAEKITSRQIAVMIAGFFMGTSIVMNPTVESGADAWLTVLVAVVGGLLITGMTAVLAVLHPGKTLVEILIACFGKIGGRIFGFSYLLFTVWLSSAVITTFSYYSVITSYPETPTLYISICYMLVIAFVVKLGLEVMGRISEILILFIIIVTAITLFSVAESFHPDAFLPMFKEGITKPVLNGLISSPLPFAEIFLALNILPNINNKKKILHSIWSAVLIAGGVIFLFTIRNISILGIDVAQRNVYPAEKVFRMMPGLNIVSLLDANVTVLGIMKVSVCLYAEAKILGDLLGLKEFKIFVLPFMLLDIIGSTLISKDIFSQTFVANKIVPLAYIPSLVIMPLIMVLISLFKKDKPIEEIRKQE